MDTEAEPLFGGKSSSAGSGKDEQPLYYDKANHPILVREGFEALLLEIDLNLTGHAQSNVHVLHVATRAVC